jgi:sulfite exporter TauE/SafE
MCGAPCAAVTGQGRRAPTVGFHLARAASYAVAGALAAASVNALAALGSVSPMFKPLWSALHAAALALGLWLAFTGRQPAWLERIGRAPAAVGAGRGGWQVIRGPGKAVAAGALWVAWPCGLLQSAILVAALADTPWGGAAVMVVFAAATALGLGAAPWLWRRFGGGQAALQSAGVAVRLAGGLLAAASAWALSADLWHKVAAYCGI